MIIHYPLLIAYLGAIALLIATPGPVVMLVIGTAARRGFRQAAWIALGTNAASLVLIAFAALLISGAVLVSTRLLGALQGLGCFVVAAMAVRTLRNEWLNSRTHPAEAHSASAHGRRRLPGVAQGFLVGIANPKDILFFVAFFPQFIGITPRSETSLAILVALWITVDFAIMTAYAAAANHPAVRRQRWVKTSSAALLLVLALAGFIATIRGETL